MRINKGWYTEMTININGYEIEIKAKYTNFGSLHNTRMNKHDTMSIINQISIWANEAALRYERIGCPAIAKTAKDASVEMYAALVKSGYFKDLGPLVPDEA